MRKVSSQRVLWSAKVSAMVPSMEQTKILLTAIGKWAATIAQAVTTK